MPTSYYLHDYRLSATQQYLKNPVIGNHNTQAFSKYTDSSSLVREYRLESLTGHIESRDFSVCSR